MIIKDITNGSNCAVTSNSGSVAGVTSFVTAAAGPVDLQLSPAGELFYVDFDGGTVRIVPGKEPQHAAFIGTGVGSL